MEAIGVKANVLSLLMQLRDDYGRSVTGLRISVTSRCNLNCIYCHGEGERRGKREEIEIETIEEIVRVASSFGIKKVKFSGGEPLIRSDFVDIIARLPKLDDVSLTTNGTFLDKYAKELAEVGLDRVNISLDSLKEEKYRLITGAPILSRVFDGIHSAVDAGLNPIKLNMVLLKGINDDEVGEMIEFARSHSLILQLIELMDFGDVHEYQFDLSIIEEMLKSRASKIRERKMHKRRKYILDDVEVEVVRPIDNSEFCANCSRLRVTSDGRLKPCLLRDDNLVDIGKTEKEISDAFKLAVKRREPFYKPSQSLLNERRDL